MVVLKVKAVNKPDYLSESPIYNHPSGVAEPSQADRRITRRLIDALALIDVKVLDHFVVSFEGAVSFAERGWI